MRILADLHISPRTIAFLESLGHEVIRCTSVLPATASDEALIAYAASDSRVILTQDLDFSARIALSGSNGPSVITLRLSTSRIEAVNAALLAWLPILEEQVQAGILATIQDDRVRIRTLPLR